MPKTTEEAMKDWSKRVADKMIRAGFKAPAAPPPPPEPPKGKAGFPDTAMRGGMMSRKDIVNMTPP